MVHIYAKDEHVVIIKKERSTVKKITRLMCHAIFFLWIATTVTSTSGYLPCVRALWSTPCRGEQQILGKGVERGRERRREWRGKAGRDRTGTGTAKGGAGVNGEGSGGGVKKAYVGGGCVRVL